MGSEVIALEINQTHDSERRSQLQALVALATLQVTVDESIQIRASVFGSAGVKDV